MEEETKLSGVTIHQKMILESQVDYKKDDL